MTQQSALGANTALFKLEYPQSLGVFDSYPDAQKAVDQLADANFPVKNLAIVGTDLRLMERVTGRRTWGTVLGEGVMSVFKSVSIPGLSNLPYVGKLLFSYNSFVYFGVVLCIVLGIYINHTSQGRSLRAVGENPAAADAMGSPTRNATSSPKTTSVVRRSSGW